ncbi:MAG: ferrous iron transport protein A [Nitrospinae bacterium]|nr:ferrous iron transport protein A [Nitrospinota bacterium]
MGTTLANLLPGERGKVTKITARGTLRRRLMDMGVITGETALVERVAPLGDPMKITVKNYCLSLRKSEAEHIAVERLRS